MVVKISAKDGFLWDDSYLIGNKQIDDQHHQLFDLINSLVQNCDDGKDKDKETIKKALDFLVDYTVRHFNDEEALQIECNFPEYEQHKQLHEDFKNTVTDLVGRYVNSGSYAVLNSDIKSIVIKWLVNHVLYEDKKIGLHLQGV